MKLQVSTPSLSYTLKEIELPEVPQYYEWDNKMFLRIEPHKRENESWRFVCTFIHLDASFVSVSQHITDTTLLKSVRADLKDLRFGSAYRILLQQEDAENTTKEHFEDRLRTAYFNLKMLFK